MEHWHLIVGLGNPGAEYAITRHNAGFLLVECLGRRWQASWRQAARFAARLARVEPEGKPCLLCQPQTYMNASGVAVSAVARYYRVPLERMLVLVDDADLPLGQVRLRPSGSAGGHHGLESVERELGSRAYARLRMGIGRRANDGRQITGHVLGRFDAEEAALFELVLERGADQAACWLGQNIQMAMNRFNGVVATPGTKEN